MRTEDARPIEEDERAPAERRMVEVREVLADALRSAAGMDELRERVDQALALLGRTNAEARQLQDEACERERAVEELRLREERYRIVAELTSDYAYAFRVEKDGTLVNEWVAGQLQRVTGYTVGELRARGGWENLIHSDDLPITLRQLRRLLAGEDSLVEYRIVTRDGEVRWVRDHGRSAWSANGSRVTHIYGAVTDITARHDAEAALRESEARLQAAVESLPFDFFAIGLDGRYILQNSTCRRNWGDVVGKRPNDVAPNLETLALWQENNRRAFAGETVDEEVELTISGDRVQFHNVIAPIRHERKIIGILGINIGLGPGRKPELPPSENQAGAE